MVNKSPMIVHRLNAVHDKTRQNKVQDLDNYFKHVTSHLLCNFNPQNFHSKYKQNINTIITKETTKINLIGCDIIVN